MIFQTYDKIHVLGHADNDTIFSNPEDTIYVEEKIDGANFRFMLQSDGRITFGSRTQSIGDDTKEIGGNWSRCVQYVSEKLKGKTVPENLVFYGECCIKHSLEYDWEKIPPYLGFDIKGDNGYLNYEEKKALFESLDLPMVPLITTLKAVEMNGKDVLAMVPQSVYANGPAEGIVFKCYSNKIFAKYVTDKFKEVNKHAFGMNKKYAQDDTGRIVAAYCTNPRIDKHVFNLVQEGHALEMSMMMQLPKRVCEDMYEENWKEIVNSKFTIDFHKARQLVGRRCKKVLNQIMTNNALNNIKTTTTNTEKKE